MLDCSWADERGAASESPGLLLIRGSQEFLALGSLRAIHTYVCMHACMYAYAYIRTYVLIGAYRRTCRHPLVCSHAAPPGSPSQLRPYTVKAGGAAQFLEAAASSSPRGVQN